MLSEDLYDRATRTERNRVLLGEFNDRISTLGGHMGFVDPVEWICECSNDICLESVESTVHDYEVVHDNAMSFIVAPSDEHVLPGVERVLERHAHHWVVERRLH